MRPRARSDSRSARKLSRLHKPDDLSLEAWQAALRRQFGRERDFRLENTGSHPIFSEFRVTNSGSGATYRVAIRASALGSNFCSCPDFATNALGTCKHIEFTLGRLERKRGARAALARGWEPPFSEVYLQYGARREVRFRAGPRASAELVRLASRSFPGGLLAREAFAQFETFVAQATRLDSGLHCYEDALEFVAHVRDTDRRAARLAEAFPRGVRSAAFRNLLRVSLYDYQREAALFACRAGRCLLADDMGLGKTIEAIAAAEIMASQFGVERVLVVCPTSLKHQWEREIARTIGRTTRVIGGTRARREKGFGTESFYKVTNYDHVHADLDLVARWAPDLVILDEAQRIKNWNTRTARSVKRIASPYALVLTGTPLENRLEELVSIVDFVDRHRLGPTFRLLHDHQIRDDAGRVVGYRDLDRLGQTLAPILLRRRKNEVLRQLPARLDKRFFVPMTPEQIQHHEENREIVARIVARWRRHRFLSEADQRRLMIALQRMRMACDSTYLLDDRSEHGLKADEVATVLEEMFEQPDTKVVVFSQWLRMHEVLVRRFERRRWSHVLFHGGLSSDQRRDVVDRFREDPHCRALLSTDAGGVGLNLQHASAVVNVDIPWNPAVFEQRVGRVLRLGQTRPVQVLSFVARDTIEEGMLSLLEFKRSVAAGVLDGGASEVFLGGSRLTRFMESVEQVTKGIPPPVAAEPPPEATPGDQAPALETSRTPADPLSALLTAGLDLLRRVGLTSGAAGRGASTGPPAAAGAFERIRDPGTGQSYLKIRMPEPEVIGRVADALHTLLESLGR